MLEAISGVCSKHKIDIKELSCKQFPVWLPDGNKQDNFHMRGYVRAFETVDVKAVAPSSTTSSGSTRSR